MIFPSSRLGANGGPFVFLHVPRTGGSSVWNYLSNHCSAKSNILDLHHEARQRFGHERRALMAAAIFVSDIHRSPKPTLIHHHGSAPLNSLFPNADFFTVLRDPVDRILSYHAHMQEAQKEGAAAASVEDTGIDFSRVSAAEMVRIKPSLSREYFLLFAAMAYQAEGLYSRSYLLDPVDYDPVFDEHMLERGSAIIPDLVSFISRTFFYIGFFDKLAQDTKSLAIQLGAVTPLPAVGHLNGRSNPTPRLSETEKVEFEQLCSLDIQLYQSLRARLGLEVSRSAGS